REEEVRDREERFDQRRVLVVDAPRAVDRSLRERRVRVRDELLEPATVDLRGLEVEAFVARVAEIRRRGEEDPGVRESEPEGDQRIDERWRREGAAEARSSAEGRRLRRRAHRVSASKQK